MELRAGFKTMQKIRFSISFGAVNLHYTQICCNGRAFQNLHHYDREYLRKTTGLG